MLDKKRGQRSRVKGERKTGKPRSGEFETRLLELARRGRGKVSPNPMVGALVEKSGKIISEGFHARFGGPHAEVVALKKAGNKARGATLWTSLEPCTIKGKTPPCSDAIIAAGISKVIFLSEDPNPRVKGTAIRVLRRSGVACELRSYDPAYALNRGFAVWVREGRPLTTLKIAASLDGRIADHKGRSRGLGNKDQLSFAHFLRAKHDAVLVGVGTVIRDDPRLTARVSATRNPPVIRIVLDRDLRMPLHSALLRDIGSGNPLWIVTNPANLGTARAKRLKHDGAILLPLADHGSNWIKRLLRELAKRGVTSVLVEGGASVLGRFIRVQAYDAFYLCLMPVFLGEQGVPLARFGPVDLKRAPRGKFSGEAGKVGFHYIAFSPDKFSIWS